MPTASDSFRSVLISLWLRLMTVGAVALLFAVTLLLPETTKSWALHLNTGETLFEVAVYLTFAALIGMALATVCTAITAPFLFQPGACRQRRAGIATRIAVGAAAFGDFAVALAVFAPWAGIWGKPKAILFLCYGLTFAVTLRIPRSRKHLLTSLDGFLGEKAARRAVIMVAFAAGGLAAAEWTMGKMATAPVMPVAASRSSRPNILLITFDSLSAEDMSLYGYRLPTTPHIDEFAGKSSVFTHFYSASTFTTASVASIVTGLHPSENLVYGLEDHLRRDYAGKTLPYWMRAGGYNTSASITNPFAYFVADSVAEEFDSLPEPFYRPGSFMNFWAATRILHQHEPFGSRAIEFWDFEKAWDSLPSRLESSSPRRFGRTISGFQPTGSFAQARNLVKQLPDGFFLWVHLMAPHWPYLPGPNLGRFLPSDEMRTHEEQSDFAWWPRYAPDKQNRIDKARLRYDEFVADADDAFGAFLSGLESAGKLRNTAVIVSSDHGESFEGGVYTHGSSYQTRPEIHIPLIIRMPGQEQGHRIAVTADETVLAPTVLDIAGLPRPDYMPGRSLLPWLNRDGEGEGQGMAFTQYLWTSSIFKPLRAGTVGVIDGRHQFILDLATGKGKLRSLAEANLWDCDRSTEDPATAETLRRAIYSRFPDLPRKSQ